MRAALIVLFLLVAGCTSEVPKTGCEFGNPACDASHDCVNNACILKTGCDYGNPVCPPNYECIGNGCYLKPGCDYGNPVCTGDYECKNNSCILKSGCIYGNPVCTDDYECRNNTCALKSGCDYGNPSCGTDYDCINNDCVLKPGCDYANPPCPSGKSCMNNSCETVKVCNQVRTFNLLVFMDENSYSVSNNEIEDYFSGAGELLRNRTCTDIDVIGVWHVRLSETGDIDTVLRDTLSENAGLARRANGFVVFSSVPETARTYGGYAFSVSPSYYGVDGYCNTFSSNSGTSQLYGSVIDWAHMFASCGYAGSNHISDVSLGGECRNQPGTPCVLHNGYYMCENRLDAYYATDRTFFTKTSIIHEIMHHFGDGGNNDHFGTQQCVARGSYERDFFCPSEDDSDCYFQMCPYVYRNFENSQNLCG